MLVLFSFFFPSLLFFFFSQNENEWDCLSVSSRAAYSHDLCLHRLKAFTTPQPAQIGASENEVIETNELKKKKRQMAKNTVSPAG